MAILGGCRSWAIAGFGVECAGGGNGFPAVLYVNTGDTYDPTILYTVRSGAFRLTTLGDWAEYNT